MAVQFTLILRIISSPSLIQPSVSVIQMRLVGAITVALCIYMRTASPLLAVALTSAMQRKARRSSLRNAMCNPILHGQRLLNVRPMMILRLIPEPSRVMMTLG
jgi:hypothetical protein